MIKDCIPIVEIEMARVVSANEGLLQRELQCVAVYYSALQCITVCCTVLHCVAL